MPPASSPRSPASFPAHRLFSAALRSVFSNLAARRREPRLPDRRRRLRSPTQAFSLSVHYWIPFPALPIDGLLLNRKNVSSLLLCATDVRCDIRRCRTAPRRRDVARPVRPNGCGQTSGCCLLRRVYSGGGEVISVGITATEARYECRASAQYAHAGRRQGLET